MRAKISRRAALKAGALVAGVPGLLIPSPLRAADTAKRSTSVVVVGAGYAGMSAAWELHKRNVDVIVVEAGPRVGGRVWSATLSDGTTFEIGGQWVADAATQPDIRQLMAELGVDDRVYAQYNAGKTTFVGLDHQVSTFPAEELPPLSAAALAEVQGVLLLAGLMASAVDVESPWRDVPYIGALNAPRSTAEADQMTVHTWVEENVTQPEAKALLRAALAGATGSDLAAMSLLHFLFELQTAGGNFLTLSGSGPGQYEQFRISGGAQQMATSIAQRLPAGSIVLNGPVNAIDQDANGVTVHAGDALTIQAKRAIVTVPIALEGGIRHAPLLPPDRAQLQQRMPQGTVWKIWLVYDTAFWRPLGLTGESTSIYPGDLIANARDGGGPQGHDAPGLMICFAMGDQARTLGAMTREARRAQVISEMVHRFGPAAGNLSSTIRFPAVTPQNPAPDNYFEFNWAVEEWARGDFAAVPGPGVYTGVGFGPAIRQPVGRVHWAGVDTATSNYASFSGAVQSGKRAAAEVLSAEAAPRRRPSHP